VSAVPTVVTLAGRSNVSNRENCGTAMQPLRSGTAGQRIHGLGQIPVIAARRHRSHQRLVHFGSQTFTDTVCAIRHL